MRIIQLGIFGDLGWEMKISITNVIVDSYKYNSNPETSKAKIYRAKVKNIHWLFRIILNMHQNIAEIFSDFFFIIIIISFFFH